MTRSKWLKQDSPSPEAISKVRNNYKSQTHPLSRLEGDVGSHPPCYSRGACTDLLRRAWGQDMTSWDCLGFCSTHARPSSASRTWAWSPCRPRSDEARGKVLPAAKKASSELSIFTPAGSKHQNWAKSSGQCFCGQLKEWAGDQKGNLPCTDMNLVSTHHCSNRIESGKSSRILNDYLQHHTFMLLL